MSYDVCLVFPMQK